MAATRTLTARSLISPGVQRLPIPNVPRFYCAKVIANLLNVSERTVVRWTKRNILVAHLFGSVTRIEERELRAFINAARRGPPASHSSDLLEEDFYTAKQVAQLLGVCTKTVRRRLKSKVLVEHDFDGIIRIARTDLQDFLSRSRRD
jgi:excisionase family DNA binding protein